MSAARNRGIDEAVADWMMFVDGDDWVDIKFCEISYNAAMENQADLVCFSFFRVTRLGRVKKPKKIDAPTGIVEEMIAHELGGWAVWHKLYKKNLFREIRFPEGHVHEDIATAHRFVKKAERIVLLSVRLYYYTDRRGSISYTRKVSDKKDGFVSAIERCDFLIEHGYPAEKIEWLPQRYAMGFLASTQSSQDAVYIKACEIADGIKGIPKEFTTKQKIALIAWKIDKRLFYLIGVSQKVCWY